MVVVGHRHVGVCHDGEDLGLVEPHLVDTLLGMVSDVKLMHGVSSLSSATGRQHTRISASFDAIIPKGSSGGSRFIVL